MLVLLFLGSAGLLATFWLVVTWLSAGGRLPLRGRRGTASGVAAAGLALEALYRPGARQAIEMRLNQEMQREDDDEGDEPVTGTASSNDVN
jgi:type VI protein secretion system component VasK